jgi:hypothetical protein
MNALYRVDGNRVATNRRSRGKLRQTVIPDQPAAPSGTGTSKVFNVTETRQ